MVLRFSWAVFLVSFWLFGLSEASAQDTLFVKTGEAILVRDLKINDSMLTYRWVSGDTSLKGISIESIAFLRLYKPPTLNASYTPEQAIALQISDSIRIAKGYKKGKRDEMRQIIKLVPTAGLAAMFLGAGVPYIVAPRFGFDVLEGIFLGITSVIPGSFLFATYPYTRGALNRVNRQGMGYDPKYCEAYVLGRQERYWNNLLIISGVCGVTGVLLTVTQR